MPYMIVRHKVQDYARWKAAFDEHADIRQQATSKGGLVLRSRSDPKDVTVMLEVQDLQKAKDFARSPELHEAMKKAGVIGRPEILLLEQMERFADRPLAKR